MTNNAYIRQLDPIQGLVDYVLDVKPYHTKIVEVMIEYVYNDDATGVVSDAAEFAWGPTRFPIASGSGLPTFSITAGQVTGVASSHYTGADPDNLLGGGVLGSIDQGSLTDIVVVALYTYGTNPTTATSITLWLSTGASPALSTAFDSITFTDALNVTRTLNRLDSNDPNGYDAGTYREWTWSISAAQVFTVGGTYSVEVTGTGGGGPAADELTLSGDFTDAIFYIMGSPAELLTIVDTDGNQTSHEIVGTPVFGAGITTVTVSPNLPPNAQYVLLEGDVVRFFSFTVTDFDEENQTITVSGPATADVFNGQRIRVMPSANVYTVQGSPTFNGLTTIIPVAETLSGETLGSPAAIIQPERYYIP